MRVYGTKDFFGEDSFLTYLAVYWVDQSSRCRSLYCMNRGKGRFGVDNTYCTVSLSAHVKLDFRIFAFRFSI